MNNKTILITGGAGYIGNVLTRELLNNNHKVTIIDNFIFSKDDRWKCRKQK